MRTPRFDALGFAFRVVADAPRVARHCTELFAEFACGGTGGHRYTFRTVRASAEAPRCELSLDGRWLGEAEIPEQLISMFVQDVNRQVIMRCDGLVLHSGAVASDDVGFVFPAMMEAGKTTLVAGLVRAGFGYLSDEAVPLDRETMLIQPYPKPLSLDPGSWPLFPELEPHADLATDDYKANQWQVPPDKIRPGSLGRSCPVGVVVFPRYKPRADTTLEPLSRAEALIELAKNTFKFKDQATEALDLLAEVVRPVACYRLTTGSLDPAVDAVSSLAGSSAPRGRAS